MIDFLLSSTVVPVYVLYLTYIAGFLSLAAILAASALLFDRYKL